MDNRLIANNYHNSHHHHHYVSNSSINNSKMRKKVKRLSGGLNHSTSGSSIGSVNTTNSYYYPSNFISNPCDQLFGPVDTFSPTLSNGNSASIIDSGGGGGRGYIGRENKQPSHVNMLNHEDVQYNQNRDSEHSNSGIDEYIPTPKWSKLQNSILEELYKKTRYPKAHELKMFALRFHVMDCDIEEWFRKRRGRDRRAKRKNESLKNLMDNYIEMKC